MKFLSKFLGAFKKVKRGKASAVILCAGASTRFSGDGKENKQMAQVLGLPVIVRTILAFECCDDIHEIVLVVRKKDIKRYEALVNSCGFQKVTSVVVGGATRQESALAGFDAISPKSSLVAIHDGARCLVTPELISKVVADAGTYRAATAASRVTDTVKMATKDGFISSTIDRDFVWNVQTPQIFEVKLYAASAYTAKEKGFFATDDCMLVENAGFKVKLVDTGKDNIKITVKDDIALAEHILTSRGEE